MSINNSKLAKDPANPYPMLTEIPKDADPSELNFIRTHEIFFSNNSKISKDKQYRIWLAFIRKCIGEDIYDSRTKFSLAIKAENGIEFTLSKCPGREIIELIEHLFHATTDITISIIKTIDLSSLRTAYIRTDWIFKEKKEL